MKISVELSMYPLAEQYIPPIELFISVLHHNSNIEVRTNGMSTQLFGEYKEVMHLLSVAMEKSMESEPKVVFVAKFLNTDVSGYGAEVNSAKL